MVATSDQLLSTRGAAVRSSLLLTHGVDYEHFARCSVLAPAGGISNLPHPILGIFGVFDNRTDGELLQRIARSFPEGTVAVIGPTDRDVRSFRMLQNIRFLGKVDYNELPSWIAGFDVCILPYHVNELTRSINPLKLREYLATGKPVVTTPLPEAEKLAPYLTIATRDDFSDAVRSVLTQTPRPSSAMREMLLSESWERKAEQFLQFVLDGI